MAARRRRSLLRKGEAASHDAAADPLADGSLDTSADAPPSEAPPEAVSTSPPAPQDGWPAEFADDPATDVGAQTSGGVAATVVDDDFTHDRTADMPRIPTQELESGSWASAGWETPASDGWGGDASWADAFRQAEGWKESTTAEPGPTAEPLADWGTEEVPRRAATATILPDDDDFEPKAPVRAVAARKIGSTPPPPPRRATPSPSATPPPARGRTDAPPVMAPVGVARPDTPTSLADRPTYQAETPPPMPKVAGRSWVRPDFDDHGQEAVVVAQTTEAPRRPWLVPALAVTGVGILGASVLLAFAILDLRQIGSDLLPKAPEGAPGAAALLGSGGGQAAPGSAETPRVADAGGVEVRSGLRQPPKFEGVDPRTLLEVGLAAEDEPARVTRPVVPAGRAERGEVGSARVDAEVGGTAPAAPSPATTQGADSEVIAPPPPAVERRPAPTLRPNPPSAPDPATVGTLKIRANRRVLVYVDGKAVGYAPTDIPVAPGHHVVRAMVPGMPSSAQTQEVDVTSVGTAVGLDFGF